MIKKTLIIVLSLICLLFIYIGYIGTFTVCSDNRDCAHLIADIARSLIICFPALGLIIITYFLRDEIFKAWLWLASVWVPVTVVAAYLSPQTYGFFPTGPAVTSLLSSILFVFISSCLIIFLLIRLRYKDQKKGS